MLTEIHIRTAESSNSAIKHSRVETHSTNRNQYFSRYYSFDLYTNSSVIFRDQLTIHSHINYFKGHFKVWFVTTLAADRQPKFHWALHLRWFDSRFLGMVTGLVNFDQQFVHLYMEIEFSWNVMAHGDALERYWRGNCQLEWVASTLHITSEHVVSSFITITTADARTSTASSRMNCRHCWFKWTRLFHRKTKSGFCAWAITFQTQSTIIKVVFSLTGFRFKMSATKVCRVKFHQPATDCRLA